MDNKVFDVLFHTDARASPCAEVRTPSKVVPFGSSVSASCHFNDDCPLMKGQTLSVVWHYNNTLIHKHDASPDKKVYEIVISNFSDLQAVIKCLVCSSDSCNIVDAVEIEAACKDNYFLSVLLSLSVSD